MENEQATAANAYNNNNNNNNLNIKQNNNKLVSSMLIKHENNFNAGLPMETGSSSSTINKCQQMTPTPTSLNHQHHLHHHHNNNNGNNALASATATTTTAINSPKMGSRRIFTPQFKLQVLESYRNDNDCKGNQRATARKYNIHRRQIQKWLQCEPNLRSSVANINQSQVKHQFHNITHHHHHQHQTATAANTHNSHYGSQQHYHHQQQQQQLKQQQLCLDAARHNVALNSSLTVPSNASTATTAADVLAAANFAAAVAVAATMATAGGASSANTTATPTATTAVSPIRPTAIGGCATTSSDEGGVSPGLLHPHAHHLSHHAHLHGHSHHHHHHHHPYSTLPYTHTPVPVTVPILTHQQLYPHQHALIAAHHLPPLHHQQHYQQHEFHQQLQQQQLQALQQHQQQQQQQQQQQETSCCLPVSTATTFNAVDKDALEVEVVDAETDSEPEVETERNNNNNNNNNIVLREPPSSSSSQSSASTSSTASTSASLLPSSAMTSTTTTTTTNKRSTLAGNSYVHSDEYEREREQPDDRYADCLMAAMYKYSEKGRNQPAQQQSSTLLDNREQHYAYAYGLEEEAAAQAAITPIDLSLAGSRRKTNNTKNNIQASVTTDKHVRNISEVVTPPPSPLSSLSKGTHAQVVDLTFRKRKVITSLCAANTTTTTTTTTTTNVVESADEQPEKMPKFSAYAVTNQSAATATATNGAIKIKKEPALHDVSDETDVKVSPTTSNASATTTTPSAKPVKLFKPYLLDEEQTCSPCTSNDTHTPALWLHGQQSATTLLTPLALPPLLLHAPQLQQGGTFHSVGGEKYTFPAGSPCFPDTSKSCSPKSLLCSPTTSAPALSPTSFRCPKGSPVSGYESSSSTYSESSYRGEHHAATTATATNTSFSLDLQLRAVYREHLISPTQQQHQQLQQETNNFAQPQQQQQQHQQQHQHVQRWLDQEIQSSPPTPTPPMPATTTPPAAAHTSIALYA